MTKILKLKLSIILPYPVALVSEHFLHLLLPVLCLTMRWSHPEDICNNEKRAGRKKSYIHFLVKIFFIKSWIRYWVKEYLRVPQRSEWDKERDPDIQCCGRSSKGKVRPLDISLSKGMECSQRQLQKRYYMSGVTVWLLIWGPLYMDSVGIQLMFMELLTVTSPYALSELPIAYMRDYCSSPVCVEKYINPELST